MGIAARSGARRLMFRLCSSGRRAHDDPFPRPSLIFATALRLLFEPAPAASAPRRDSRRERGAHEGLPSEQNAHLRAGIEKETEAVPLVSPRHRPPAIPIAPLQACGGSGRPTQASGSHTPATIDSFTGTVVAAFFLPEASHAESHESRQEPASFAGKTRRAACKDCACAAAREDRARAVRAAREDRARAAPQTVARSRLARRRSRNGGLFSGPSREIELEP